MDKANEITRLKDAIAAFSKKAGRPVKLMEVCGTHTVALFRHGIRSLLPQGLGLLSGPGCPVCVTSIEDVDIAIEVAGRPDAMLFTFGDMMRVPGSSQSLLEAKAQGADVRMVYSPLDALKAARAVPEKKAVFFATGFETTSPIVAGSIVQARNDGVENFHVHTVHKLVPPALDALLSSGEVAIDGFILPGHVCSMTGTAPFEFLAQKHNIPSVVTGFGAQDILEGIMMLMKQIAQGGAKVEIQYAKVVRPEGNPKAIETINEVFEPTDAYWRGIGTIPASGLMLRDAYAHFSLESAFGGIKVKPASEPKGCSCGDVLKGLKTPSDCPLFGRACTPERPVGACMVSAEGSCAAYFKYGALDQV